MPTINFSFFSSATSTSESVPKDIGSVSNTGGTSTQGIYITHDHTSALYNVGLYIRPYNGNAYVGVYGESNDYNKVLDWGNNLGKGLVICFDTATGTAFNVTPYYNSTTQVGTGNSVVNAIPLTTNVFLNGSSTAQGHFPAGETAHVTLLLSIPSSETVPASNQIDISVTYTQ